MDLFRSVRPTRSDWGMKYDEIIAALVQPDCLECNKHVPTYLFPANNLVVWLRI